MLDDLWVDSHWHWPTGHGTGPVGLATSITQPGGLQRPQSTTYSYSSSSSSAASNGNLRLSDIPGVVNNCCRPQHSAALRRRFCHDVLCARSDCEDAYLPLVHQSTRTVSTDRDWMDNSSWATRQRVVLVCQRERHTVSFRLPDLVLFRMCLPIILICNKKYDNGTVINPLRPTVALRIQL